MESDGTEMTLLQSTVFLAGDDGGNTADGNDKNHYAIEASVLKTAVGGFIYIYIYMT
jgi:hypothetical protein